MMQRVIATGRENLVISSVTVAELAFGVEKSNRPDSAPKLKSFLSQFPILPWDADAAWIYSRIRKDLEGKGQRIGELDLLLAAQARALNLIVVTNNMREFERVEGLKLENWAV